MNIIATSNCPDQSARWLVDAHMKLGLEATQCLCTAYHEQGIEAPYRPSHRNHPTAKWIRASYDNFQWTIAHGHAIFNEYTARYEKIHKSQAVLDWCEDNVSKLGFDSFDLTPFAIAISEDSICRTLPEFESLHATEKYVRYVQYDKRHLHAWKRNKPWWAEDLKTNTYSPRAESERNY
jgi:hypothetical protein